MSPTVFDDDQDDIVVQSAAVTKEAIDAMMSTMRPAHRGDCALVGLDVEPYYLAALAARLRIIGAVERGDRDSAREAHADVRRRQREAAQLAGYDPELVGAPCPPQRGLAP